MPDPVSQPSLDSVGSLLSAWTHAELTGDTDRLDRLLTTDFHAIGPLGFILPRDAWIDRHQSGELTYQTFDLLEQQTRQFDDITVITARNATIGTYRGQPIPEAMRVTLIATSNATGWRLAHAHMSFIAGTAGAPPIPESNQ